MHPAHEHLPRCAATSWPPPPAASAPWPWPTCCVTRGLLAAEAVNPLAPKARSPPRPRRASASTSRGRPSQIDLWDPKPKLDELHGQALPESMTKNVRFAFIQKETARLLGSPRKFKKHGQCGMELSDFLPYLGTVVDDIAFVRSMHTEAFNHHPGQLAM